VRSGLRGGLEVTMPGFRIRVSRGIIRRYWKNLGFFSCVKYLLCLTWLVINQ
jgi:hypothetical protein